MFFWIIGARRHSLSTKVNRLLYPCSLDPFEDGILLDTPLMCIHKYCWSFIEDEEECQHLRMTTPSTREAWKRRKKKQGQLLEGLDLPACPEPPYPRRFGLPGHSSLRRPEQLPRATTLQIARTLQVQSATLWSSSSNRLPSITSGTNPCMHACITLASVRCTRPKLQPARQPCSSCRPRRGRAGAVGHAAVEQVQSATPWPIAAYRFSCGRACIILVNN